MAPVVEKNVIFISTIVSPRPVVKISKFMSKVGPLEL